MPTSTLTSKGQITVPKPIREYLHVTEGDQVDFAISEIPPFGIEVRDLIECEVTDVKAHAALIRFTAQQPKTASARLVGDLRQPRELELVSVRPAADWLARLSA